MTYSIEPRDTCKNIDFFSFSKNIGKNLSNKQDQKFLDSAKKSPTETKKTASKRAIQKTAEATGDLIANKIADKITSVSKKSPKELQKMKQNSQKRYICPEERHEFIDQLSLV